MLWTDFDAYLRPEHLHGKAVKAKIAHVRLEKFFSKGKSFEKPVLYFEGGHKGLPVNTTNRRAIMAAFGEDAGACVGQAIVLEPITDDGKETIRVRPAG